MAAELCRHMSYITQTLTGELVLHAAHEPETKTSDLATKSRNFKSYIYHKSLANHKRLAHFLRHSYTIHDGHNPQPMAAESTDLKLSDANVSSGESDCMSYMNQFRYLKPRYERSAPHVIHVPVTERLSIFLR